LISPGAWLDSRLMDAPSALRDAVNVQRAACGVQRDGTAAEFVAALRTCAEGLLAEARRGSATRETALKLLAADALVTLACEWVAETDPPRLDNVGPVPPPSRASRD
jgi:hypothetical protein